MWESNEPCICCMKNGKGMTCYHHLYSRKAYPEFSNKEWNKISVCQEHHNMFHNKGISFMANKFTRVRGFLIKHKWKTKPFQSKWFHEGESDTLTVE